ncbi:putative trans-zeatin O-beta-D-glucosyltransferase [Helianthus annuus]|nr:putative trans-zeatin O-beta-D-glucosyltransferase [Helianthus annuus]
MSTVVQDVVSYPNVEAYVFHCASAFTTFSYMWEEKGRPCLEDDNESYMHLSKLANIQDLVPPEFFEFIYTHVGCEKFKSAIFTILPKYLTVNSSTIFREKGFLIQELAIGLEKSGQKFIWVLRDADKGDIFKGEGRNIELPIGFEERVEGKGLVVREWAPQLEILAHIATGGFMSHCGWNSSMEGITMGVPIAAWPMHSDQPRNAMLITDVLKIGVNVGDWGRDGEVVTSLVIEKAIRILMDSDEGNGIRKRANKLGEDVRQSVEEGGVTRMEINAFVDHITRQ